MRVLACCLLALWPSWAAAQDADPLAGGPAAFEGFTGFDGLSLSDGFGLGDMEPLPRAPIAYGGCLVAEDKVTPLVCASGDGIRPLPDGFSWRDDAQASLSEPRHCLWWEEGDAFVGGVAPSVCRKGAAPKARPTIARDPNPFRRPERAPVFEEDVADPSGVPAPGSPPPDRF